MQAEFKSDMSKNYMIIRQEHIASSNYRLQMLINNFISGLLKLEVHIVDNINLYYYDITSKQPIKLMLEKGNVTREVIIKIMQQLILTLENSNQYLLNKNDFVINPEYIYMDLTSEDLSLCHIIGFDRNIREQICEFIEFLMNKVDYRDESAVLLIYGLYKVSLEDNCNLDQLRLLIEESEKPIKESPNIMNLDNDGMETYSDQKQFLDADRNTRSLSIKNLLYLCTSFIATVTIFYIIAKLGWVYNKTTNTLDFTKVLSVLFVVGGAEAYILYTLLSVKNNSVKAYNKQESINPTMSINNFINSQEQTTVLSEAETIPIYKLTPLEANKYHEILLIDFPFFIGALKMKVDYAIENHTVSRYHAKLERIDDKFFIVDLNSTNGTFVNRIRLGVQEKKEICLNDEIAFSEVRYIFTSV